MKPFPAFRQSSLGFGFRDSSTIKPKLYIPGAEHKPQAFGVDVRHQGHSRACQNEQVDHGAASSL